MSSIRPVQVAVVVPAYNAAASVAEVVQSLIRHLGDGVPIVVVDDGSSDATAQVARDAGAQVLQHSRNLGKGAALVTGLREAASLGSRVAVSVDADGQHPANEALRLATSDVPLDALVLGVRNLGRDGAPAVNRFSNAFSNAWISLLCRTRFQDTQCGLRRYPVAETLDLGCSGRGYDFEAEVIIRASRAGWRIEEVPVRVYYPPERVRITHFRKLRDPARIVHRVLWTAATVKRR